MLDNVIKRDNENPLISIIIPSYNQGKYIRETIESCLSQDYRPIEIIIFDGASTDDTVSILKEFDDSELWWVSEADEGVVDAVNKGLKKANGELITIQSSDDVFLPGAFDAVVEAYKGNREADLFFGNVKHINENSHIMGEDVIPEFILEHYLGRFTYIPQPGTFITRSALATGKGWRQAYSYVADADFWMRIVFHHKVKKIERYMAAYRYHPEQRDTQKDKIAKDWQAMIRDLIKIESLDGRKKRYARMGIHLANYRYTPESEWLRRTGLLYRAALACPESVGNKRFPKRELVPGRTPIWKMLSKIKRVIGLRQKNTLPH